MSGWASAAGEMGRQLENRNQTLLQQRFAHQENELRMTQEQARYFAEHISKLATEYINDPEMKDLAIDAGLIAAGGNLDQKSIANLAKMVSKAQQIVRARRAEERAVQVARSKNTPDVNEQLDRYNSGSVQPQSPSGGGSAGGGGAPNIAPVPPPYAPQAPLASMIGGGGLAQPATSPVQGGGMGADAAFRPATPGGRPGGAGVGTGAPSTPPAIPPVAQPAGLANGPEPRGTSAALGPDAAVPPPLMDLDAAPPLLQLSAGASSTAPVNPYLSQQVARDYEMYQITGHMTPLLEKTFGLQAQTDQTVDLEGRKGQLTRTQGKQRVEDVMEFFRPLNLPPEQAAYIGAEAYNPSMQFPPPPTQHELSPGEALIGPDGKLLYLNPATATSSGTFEDRRLADFMAAAAGDPEAKARVKVYETMLETVSRARTPDELEQYRNINNALLSRLLSGGNMTAEVGQMVASGQLTIEQGQRLLGGQRGGLGPEMLREATKDDNLLLPPAAKTAITATDEGIANLSLITDLLKKIKAEPAISTNRAKYTAEMLQLVKTIQPIIARAIGHTGVLTQIDADSSTSLAPGAFTGNVFPDWSAERLALLATKFKMHKDAILKQYQTTYKEGAGLSEMPPPPAGGGTGGRPPLTSFER